MRGSAGTKGANGNPVGQVDGGRFCMTSQRGKFLFSLCFVHDQYKTQMVVKQFFLCQVIFAPVFLPLATLPWYFSFFPQNTGNKIFVVASF